jgi:hypothetical protein
MDAVFPQVRHVSDPTQERVEHNRVPVRLRLTLRLRGGIVQVVFAGSPLLKGIDLSSNGDDQRGCGSGCEKIQGAPKGGDPAGTGDMKLTTPEERGRQTRPHLLDLPLWVLEVPEWFESPIPRHRHDPHCRVPIVDQEHVLLLIINREIAGRRS